MALPSTERRRLIEWEHAPVSIARQCRLPGLARSTPWYGAPRMTHCLRAPGYMVNHKQVARLMRVMRLRSEVPRRRTSVPAPGHTIYPYVLSGLTIERPNHVWKPWSARSPAGHRRS